MKPPHPFREEGLQRRQRESQPQAGQAIAEALQEAAGAAHDIANRVELISAATETDNAAAQRAKEEAAAVARLADKLANRAA